MKYSTNRHCEEAGRPTKQSRKTSLDCFASLAMTLLACSTLTSCVSTPNYTPPQDSFLERWFAPETAHVSQEPITTEWWTVFKDPLLEHYIHQAAEHNKDIEIALANLRRARALRQEQGAALWPLLDSGGNAGRSKTSDNLSASSNGQTRNLYEAGFDASWEMDIFGGNRSAAEAAAAREESALADYQGVMLSAFSEVARNYYEARGLQKRIAITTRNAKLQKRTYDLIKRRRDAGEASEFDLTRARGEYQLTRARIPNLKAEQQATIFNLSVLLGQPPEALLEEMGTVKPLPAPPDVVPIGLRSDLLRRRPDIRAAERDLAATAADIGVETAELFPKFSLTGALGTEARSFGDLFKAAGGVWSLAGLVQWPVFDGGAIRARVKAAEAENDAALALYQKTVLSALTDAETALTRYGRELETRKRLAQGVHSRRQSVKLAEELFNAGEEDYLAVLDAQRELTASEDDLVISETQSLVKLITLYTALGGGWETLGAASSTDTNNKSLTEMLLGDHSPPTQQQPPSNI